MATHFGALIQHYVSLGPHKTIVIWIRPGPRVREYPRITSKHFGRLQPVSQPTVLVLEDNNKFIQCANIELICITMTGMHTRDWPFPN